MVSSAISAPVIRPLLPRTSSAASGLRFCGMMELPVENRSESATKPNCALDQSTSSSAKRERCIAISACRRQRLHHEVAVGDRVDGVGRRPVEAQQLGGHGAVDGIGGPGERGGAERRFVEPPAAVGDARPRSRPIIST